MYMCVCVNTFKCIIQPLYTRTHSNALLNLYQNYNPLAEANKISMSEQYLPAGTRSHLLLLQFPHEDCFQ